MFLVISKHQFQRTDLQQQYDAVRVGAAAKLYKLLQ